MSGVVVTGMGLISTAGAGIGDFWNTLVKGETTYREMNDYKNNSNYRSCVGARIAGNSWEKYLNISADGQYGKASKYVIYAVLSALKDAGLSSDDLPPERTALIIGTTMGEIQAEERISELEHEKGTGSIPEDLLASYRTDNITAAVMKTLRISGPQYTVPAACAAGNYAVAMGRDLLEWGCADLAIVGGVDVFSRVAFTGFQRLLSLSPDVCRPFSRHRKGLVVGEGCGVLILEKYASAGSRRAGIRGEIIGVGLTSDRYHMTTPHPAGDGAVRSMRKALRDADLSPGDIDYISAHGTGTPANDRIEAGALGSVFGRDSIPPVSSIKSMLGHAMGAASALELIASLQMMEHGVMLPTMNYIGPDPDCPIDCVPNRTRPAKLDCVLSNSFGFGGQNSSIIIRRCN